jgi:hypothetical protein
MDGGFAATGIDPGDIQAAHVGNFAAELYAMQAHLGAFVYNYHDCFSITEYAAIEHFGLTKSEVLPRQTLSI